MTDSPPVFYDHDHKLEQRRIEQMPSLKMQVGDREVTFGHASDLIISVALRSDGQSDILLMSSCPSQTSAGMFITMSPAEARSAADTLLKLANRIERIERGGGIQ